MKNQFLEVALEESQEISELELLKENYAMEEYTNDFNNYMNVLDNISTEDNEKTMNIYAMHLGAPVAAVNQLAIEAKDEGLITKMLNTLKTFIKRIIGWIKKVFKKIKGVFKSNPAQAKQFNNKEIEIYNWINKNIEYNITIVDTEKEFSDSNSKLINRRINRYLKYRNNIHFMMAHIMLMEKDIFKSDTIAYVTSNSYYKLQGDGSLLGHDLNHINAYSEYSWLDDIDKITKHILDLDTEKIIYDLEKEIDEVDDRKSVDDKEDYMKKEILDGRKVEIKRLLKKINISEKRLSMVNEFNLLYSNTIGSFKKVLIEINK